MSQPLLNKIKAVFFDIDETLYMKDTDTLPPSVLPALKKLQDQGIIVGIATGRVEASFPQKIHQLVQELNIDTVVTSNGQFVKCQGKILRNKALSKNQILPLLDFLKAQQLDYCTLNNDKLCVSSTAQKLQGALNPISTNYEVNPCFVADNPVLQILSFHDESQDYLFHENPLLNGLKTIRWHKDSVDIFEETGSKARGIQLVAEYLGFTMENVMAFGDGLNDIEMLCEVGEGVAMGNGCEKVKSIAKHIALPIYEDGIAKFLQSTGLIK